MDEVLRLETIQSEIRSLLWGEKESRHQIVGLNVVFEVKKGADSLACPPK